MVYIHSTDLQHKNFVRLDLCNIYGLGFHQSQKICVSLGIKPRGRVYEISRDIFEKMNHLLIQQKGIGKDCKTIIKQNMKRLIQINSYRGFRHIAGYPSRGQRTHTNGKTSKKKRHSSI